MPPRLLSVLLYGSYYYGRFIGMISFAIDFHSEQVRSSCAIILYCIFVNVVVLIKVPLLYDAGVINYMKLKLRPLHLVMYVVTSLVCVAGTFIAIVFGWMRRQQILAVLRDFLALRREYFQNLELPEELKCAFERKVVTKITLGILADVLIYIVEVDLIGDDWHDSLARSITVLALLRSYVNTVANLYTCMQFCLQLHFEIINKEIGHILSMTRSMAEERHHRPFLGTFVTMCSQFADELDALNLAHKRLREFSDRINNVLDIQGGCIILDLFCNNISMIYMGYVFIKSQNLVLKLSPLGVCLIVAALLCYYFDRNLFVNGLNDLVLVTSRARAILRDHLPLPVLDARLERSIEALNINLSIDPLEHNMHGLFSFDLQFAFSLFVSALSNSIILMQYDYKYY